jgi:ATP phosphoribosyltransferase
MKSKGGFIQDVVDSFQSVIVAENKKYIMADIPKDRLVDAETIIPGIGGPTVLEIAGNDQFLAVHAVIDGKDVFDTIAKLKKIGAKGILTTPIERLVN